MLLLLIGLQDPPPPVPKKPSVERQIKAKSEESYKIELSTYGKEPVRHDYTMRLKVGPRPAEDGLWPLDVVLTDLTTKIAGKEIKRATFGSMIFTMGPAGSPNLLTFVSTTLPFSLPLLSLSLPETDATPFEFTSPLYDEVVIFKGRGTVKKGPEMTVGIDSRLHIAGEARDDSMFRKFNMTSVFRSSDGALLRSTGKYVANDGTVSFRLTRIGK